MTGMQKRKFGDVIVYIILTLVTFLTIIPVWWIINKALSKESILTNIKISILPEGGTTLSNFTRIFTYNNGEFVTWFKNSLILSASTTIIVIIFATSAGYAFSRFKFPGKNVGMVGFLIYMMLPTSISMIAQYKIWDKLQLLNTYGGMIIIYVAGSMTFTIWTLKGYFDTIPKALEEAALIDGAGRWTVFTKIMLPLSVPSIAVSALFAFITPWTDFAGGWLFISDPSKYTLGMGLYGWVSDPRNTPWNLFSAGSIIIAVPVAILYFMLQKYIVGGLTAGGVKG